MAMAVSAALNKISIQRVSFKFSPKAFAMGACRLKSSSQRLKIKLISKSPRLSMKNGTASFGSVFCVEPDVHEIN